jgi:hypothetical protein
VAGLPVQIVIGFAYIGRAWLDSFLEGRYDIDAQADEGSVKGLFPKARADKMRLRSRIDEIQELTLTRAAPDKDEELVISVSNFTDRPLIAPA